MYLLKISLLLLYTALHVHASITKKTLKPWQYNTRKVNRLIDDRSNCICYPEGQLPTVHDLLDSQNNGLERIVIYLYKNVRTNEIKMFSPSAEKQVHIPDIPYEDGDILVTITNEPITSIFHNNPNRVKVYNNRFETFNPAVTDSLPIGLNFGAIEHIYPNDINNLAPNNGYGGNEYNFDIRPNQENGFINNGPNKVPIKNVPENMISNKWNIPEGDSNANPEIIEQHWWSNKIRYPNRNPQIPSNKQYPNIDGLNEHVYTFKTNDGSYQLGSPEDLNNPLPNPEVTFNMWFNQQMERFQDVILPHDIKSIDTYVLRSLVVKTLSENGIHISSDGVITNYNGLVIDAANLELRPMLIGETVDHKILQNSLSTIFLPKHLPYLEAILVTLVYPSQVLGIIPLGKTYLTSQTSYLSDSKISQPVILNSSNIYSYSNGNAASYSGRNRGPYPLNVKETYSGANKGLVSSYAYSGNREPKSSYSYSNIREPLSPSYPYSSSNIEPDWGSNKEANLGVTEVSYWSSGPYTSVPQGPYLDAKFNPSKFVQPLGERRKLSDAKIKHHYEPPKQKNKKKGKGLSTEKPKIINQTKIIADVSKEDISEPIISLNESVSGRRFPLPSLKGVMKTLLYLLSDLPSRRDNKLELNSTEEVDILTGSENMNDGERPDFRIIGGNAATGSGTPLSNKGRSGYNYFI